MTLDTPFSPAAERNKQPILDVLRQVLPARGRALEVASGTGQHVACFAAGFPGWVWQPTDVDKLTLVGIAANTVGLKNVRAPLLLNVLQPSWLLAASAAAGVPADGRVAANDVYGSALDAVYCANMLHISPWDTCAALMRGSALRLTEEGVLITYGPYLEEGVSTAPGNLAFEGDLRLRDPAWGLRSVRDVSDEARRVGLGLRARYEMPANNLLLVFGFE